MDVIDNTRVVSHGTGGDYTIHTNITQDVGDVIAENHRRSESHNGFSDGRTQRTIATLSGVEYLQALQLGYNLDDPDPHEITREIKRYLNERGRDKGYQAVKHILTPGRSANIIIK